MTSRLASCALTSLARRLGQMSLARSQPVSTTELIQATTTICRNSSSLSRLSLPSTSFSVLTLFGTKSRDVLETCSLKLDAPQLQVNRTFATRKKRLAKRQKRRLEEKRAAKVKETVEAGGETEGQAAPQHEAWVEFQKSISVEGFQTGQTTKAKVIQKGESGQKLRDLKRREKLEMRMASKRPEISDVRGGHFPTHRYSDEETERLLATAYASIPERAGKRGTRNLKRQKRRWFLVRKIHAKEKYHRTKAHFRKMEARSNRLQEIKAIKAEAPDVRASDREYQKEVLRRWRENLAKYDNEYSERELIQAEATVVGQDAKA